MQESWPACGGSTSVGTSPARVEVEKSRSRATGASNTISCGVVQVGARRFLASSNQRGSSATPGPPDRALAQQSTVPVKAISQASSQLSSRLAVLIAGVLAGKYCDVGATTTSLRTKSTGGMDPPGAPRFGRDYLRRLRAVVA